MGMNITRCLLVEFHIFLEALGLALLRRKNGSFILGKKLHLMWFCSFFSFSSVKLHLSVTFFFFTFVQFNVTSKG